MPQHSAPPLDIERVVATYSDMLLRLALHHTQNQSDAEDVVQTVLLKLFSSPPAFTSTEHEKAWLIRVTINQCHDTLRSAYRKRAVPLEHHTELAAPPAKGNTHVLSAVRSLPEKYRNVVFLYYYEGYSTKEISSILSLRQSTVESHLFRARAKLRTLLEGEWA